MAAKVSRVQKMMGEMAEATQEDLDELRQEIATQEQAVEDYVAERRKGIDALRQLERTIDVRLNGNPKRKPKEPKQPKADSRGDGEATNTRDRVYDLLSRNREPMKVGVIAAELGVSHPTVYNALNHEWFAKGPDGYEIARAG